MNKDEATATQTVSEVVIFHLNVLNRGIYMQQYGECGTPRNAPNQYPHISHVTMTRAQSA
jgi:hypothetical protein